jgi:hypothetical protein
VDDTWIIASAGGLVVLGLVIRFITIPQLRARREQWQAAAKQLGLPVTGSLMTTWVIQGELRGIGVMAWRSTEKVRGPHSETQVSSLSITAKLGPAWAGAFVRAHDPDDVDPHRGFEGRFRLQPGQDPRMRAALVDPGLRTTLDELWKTVDYLCIVRGELRVDIRGGHRSSQQIVRHVERVVATAEQLVRHVVGDLHPSA